MNSKKSTCGLYFFIVLMSTLRPIFTRVEELGLMNRNAITDHGTENTINITRKIMDLGMTGKVKGSGESRENNSIPFQLGNTVQNERHESESDLMDTSKEMQSLESESVYEGEFSNEIFEQNGNSDEQVIGRRIPCQIRPNRWTMIHFSPSYTIILHNTRSNTTVSYTCAKFPKKSPKTPENKGKIVFIIVKNPRNASKERVDKSISRKDTLMCQRMTSLFNLSRAKSVPPRNYRICILMSNRTRALKTSTEKSYSENPDNSDQMKNSNRHLRVNFWTQENSLLIANVSWNLGEAIESSKHVQYLLTWEVVGAGLRGNLITDDNSATITLLSDNAYMIQVGVLAGSENLTAISAIDIMQSFSEFKVVNSSALSILFNTGDATIAGKSGEELSSQSVESSVDQSENNSESNAQEELDSESISRANREILTKSEVNQTNAKVPDETFAIAQTSSDIDNSMNLRVDKNVETIELNSFHARNLKVKNQTDHEIKKMKMLSKCCDENPLLPTEVVVILFVAIVIIFFLYHWLRLKRFQSSHSSVKTISDGKLALTNHPFSMMKTPLKFSDAVVPDVSEGSQIPSTINDWRKQHWMDHPNY